MRATGCPRSVAMLLAAGAVLASGCSTGGSSSPGQPATPSAGQSRAPSAGTGGGTADQLVLGALL
ncbi:MAG: hypothetical protein ACXV2J_03675, partial [Actinomycetes bacterium]